MALQCLFFFFFFLAGGGGGGGGGASIHTGDRLKIIMLHIKRKSHKMLETIFQITRQTFGP